ncbi:MAG: O-antigen ligase family protein [Pseudomonas helleri]|jgi:uncharacterized membrane-anchored protein|uniref:O-antigen ligase family protein n=1 Tax=Pseudomonas helleri TaxID=1608996 RepID=UPI003A0FCAE3
MLTNQNLKRIYPQDLVACGIVILAPFSNLILQGSGLGILGASASFPFALTAGLLIVATTLLRQRIKKRTLIILGYCFAITLLYTAFISDKVNTENAYIKGIKFSTLYLIAISCAFIQIRKTSLINTSCWIALIICAISLYPPFAEIKLLNYAGNSEGRPRGFTMESSHYALIVGSISAIIFHTDKSALKKSIAVSAGLLMIIVSQSKAGILLYCLSFFIYYAQGLFEKKSKNRNILFFILALSLITLVAIPFFLERMQNDIDKYTSTATRVVGFVSAFKIALENPLGVGFLGYVEYYLNEIPKAITTVKSYVPYLDFTEITDYTKQQSTQSLGTKSFFADSLIVFGFPFLIAYFYSFKILYKKAKSTGNTSLLPGIIFIYLSLLFWTSGIGFYIAFLIPAFLTKKKTIKNENINYISRLPIPS